MTDAYRTPTVPHLSQGDILTNVRIFELDSIDESNKPSGRISIRTTSIVVTQDCDLAQDFKATASKNSDGTISDKSLIGVLLCGVYRHAAVKAGSHRGTSKQYGRQEWKPVIQNQDPRFQNLGYVPGINEELVADFKDFFMVPRDFLYSELQQGNVIKAIEMTSPYKEQVLQRYCQYMMRVGLPNDFCNLLPPPETDLPPTKIQGNDMNPGREKAKDPVGTKP